jgi:hypothetical protein
MLRRHPALQVDVREQRPRRGIRSAHAGPHGRGHRTESYSPSPVSRREVQQPARSHGDLRIPG